jgi:hypothetical protein
MARSEDQPGLRLRLAHVSRRLPAQHGFLNALLATTSRALERMAPAEAQEALLGFRGALDAHFQLEEEVYFPALHGLQPGLEVEIAELAREHHALRDRLLVLEGRASREPGPVVAQEFVELSHALRQHEAREERVFTVEASNDIQSQAPGDDFGSSGS